MKKTVYAHDAEGVYVGKVMLDNSDLSPMEPGVWLIPGNCLEARPPTNIGAGRQIVRAGNKWMVRDIPKPAEEDESGSAAQQEAGDSPEEPALRAVYLRVEDWLEQNARSAGYRDLVTAISYADEPAVPQFQEEGRRIRAWRSLVWARVFALNAEAMNGERDALTADTVIELLPALVLVDPPEDEPAAESEGATET